ncbi:CPBP family intramembrane glutamic endopeptidase [Maribacter aestuarii]|uniref:CPBP family intramembrane glutamic endopeptidase n=1 Tax=Maribacter aestuarii TaxID=1130723 RepID=UPI00248CEA36|nr:CPBP family intramembrane glutamic endopeptidase [Maribacter aestuarii]
MLNKILAFIISPIYLKDQNKDFKYRSSLVFKLVVYSVVINVVLGLLIGTLESVFGMDLGKHAIDDFFKRYSLIFIFFAAVIIAPVVEELIFRGPMVWFKNKPYFPLIFYILTLVFGFYHITNFEITFTIIVLSPILVAPQIIVGSLLGYVRVKFGLLWAIAFHASYNLILLGPLILVKMLKIPLE